MASSSSMQIHRSARTFASPSSSLTMNDVLLSFISSDTGKMFVDPLCAALRLDGIRTISLDNHLEAHEEMFLLTLLAIEESKVIIVVLSKNYASSEWCLDELVEILKVSKRGNKLVIPIFYHVDPWEIRHQTDEFGDEFGKHADRIRKEKIETWKAALTEIGSLSGYHLPISHIGSPKLFSKIVQTVKLNIIKFSLLQSLGHHERSRSGKNIFESAATHHLNGLRYGERNLESAFSRLLLQIDSFSREMKLTGSEVWGSLSMIESIHLMSLGTNPSPSRSHVLGARINSVCKKMPSFEGCKVMSEIPVGAFSLFENLVYLTNCKSLTKLPDGISEMTRLRHLILSDCRNLAAIPESLNLLRSLSVLHLPRLKGLDRLPDSIERISSLQSLKLAYCAKLEKLPKFIKKLRCLQHLDSSGGCLKEFPTGLSESPGMFYVPKDSINRLATPSQADKMEMQLDFSEKQALLEIVELLGPTENVLKYKITKIKLLALRGLKVIDTRNSILSQFLDKANFADLERLYLQQNLDLSQIPSSFFERILALKVLDISNMNIKLLPPWVYKLDKLEELVLRNCGILMELPPEISALGNLKVLNLEGTDLVCLPEKLGELTKLRCLMVTLYDAESYRKRKGIVAMIPRKTLAKLTQLEELSVNVNPEDTWCSAAVEALMEDLSSLRKLNTLKLYLPTTVLLQNLMELEWNSDGLSVYQNLLNFSLIIGPYARRFISCLPSDLDMEFRKLKKCVKYVNGEDNTTKLAEALKQANALYLDQHWAIKKLSVFNIEELKKLIFILLVDCNDLETVFDCSDFYHEVANEGNNCLSLQYLAIHSLKNLVEIWKGPGAGCCLQSLKVLVVNMCPNLTTIFTPVLLRDLVNLEEITVEDCPKITRLTADDSTQLTAKAYLPRLKILSLFYLPELVSISSGLSFGPELENIVIYDCPKLKTLPSMGVCNKEGIKINGESEWWDALEWNEPEWSGGQPQYLDCAFCDLDIDGKSLSDFSPQYGNSLRLFVEKWQC